MSDIDTTDPIARRILLLRGRRVMLDRDLAELYGVEVRALNQAVKRNVNRFPDDFMFRLTKDEAENSRSQNVILKQGHNIKHLPFAFSEQGIAMLSSVLNSEKAIEVNIKIMRAFVRMRNLLTMSEEWKCAIGTIEKRLDMHDRQIQTAFAALKSIFDPQPVRDKRLYSPDEKKRMGFGAKKKD